MNNISSYNKSENEFFYVNDNVPNFVYILSAVYMAIIFFFAFIANTGIMIVFLSSPSVSIFDYEFKLLV